MDEVSVRKQLSETHARLEEIDQQRIRLEAERKVLLSLIDGFSGWLELNGATPAPAVVRTQQLPRSFLPKGTISMREAVMRVLQDSGGKPLHARVILERVRALGVQTDAADPLTIIDNNIAVLKKTMSIDRPHPRTYRLKSA